MVRAGETGVSEFTDELGNPVPHPILESGRIDTLEQAREHVATCTLGTACSDVHHARAAQVLRNDGWVDDLAAATRYVQTHEQVLTSDRKPKYPPHWYRCTYMRNGVRCTRLEGLHTEHEEPK